MCGNCQYYSYRVNGERITAVSGWCTHSNRLEGSDVVND